MRLSVILVLALVACGNDKPLGEITCPAVAGSRGTLYDEPKPVVFDVEAKGTLTPDRFAAHALGVPLAGGLTLHITYKVAAAGQIPVLFVYGPREPNGEFGACRQSGAQGAEAAEATLDVVVPAGAGGEYLILVATNPLKRSTSAYTLLVTCEGDGCGTRACPPLGGQKCEDEICPSGFNLDPTGCPTCGCHQTQCGPFQKRVFDQCVCSCPEPKGPAVCGADGKTYPSGCDAQCNQIAIVRPEPCDCKPLSGCDKQCEHGFRLDKGCLVCECADACQGASPTYEPVCGMDGLTHTNPDRARCEGTQVAYLGPCLPYCELPKGCNLTCPFGLRPLPGLGVGCFECQCAEPTPEFAGQPCPPGGPPWCAEWGGAIDASGSSWSESLLDAVSDLDFPRHRTFPNACAALASGWKPVGAAACPSFACARDEDCDEAAIVLGQSLGGGGPGPVPGPVKHPVTCLLPSKKKFSIGVCRIKTPPEECTTDGQCPKGTTCQDTPQGKRCRSPCECLNSLGSRVYEPACVKGKDYFNPCFALCAGEWPVEHPGLCCDGKRLPVQQLSAAWSELDLFCAAKAPPFVAAFELSTSCPPAPEQCKDDHEDACCRPPAP